MEGRKPSIFRLEAYIEELSQNADDAANAIEGTISGQPIAVSSLSIARQGPEPKLHDDSNTVEDSERVPGVTGDLGTDLVNARKAWGQYLDSPTPKQHGLYGTSSAVGVLTSLENKTLRQEGLEYLITRYEQRSRAQPNKKREFQVIPKIAAFLSAFEPNDLSDTGPLSKRIQKTCYELIKSLDVSQNDDYGWGYQLPIAESEMVPGQEATDDSESGDQLGVSESEVIPTSLVLLAVQRLGLLHHLNNPVKAGEWIQKRITSREEYITMNIGELVLALTAIRLCNVNNRKHALPNKSLTRVERYLFDQVRSAPSVWREYFVSYEVHMDEERHQGEYFVICSPFLILEYLCRFAPDDLLTPEMLRKTQNIINGVLKNDYYISDLNRRPATRPNYFAHSFLKQFSREIPDRLADRKWPILARACRDLLFERVTILILNVLFWIVVVSAVWHFTGDVTALLVNIAAAILMISLRFLRFGTSRETFSPF